MTAPPEDAKTMIITCDKQNKTEALHTNSSVLAINTSCTTKTTTRKNDDNTYTQSKEEKKTNA